MPQGSCILKSLTLKNVRGFRHVKVSLENQNLVLVGANNAGKTSLLRILNWILTEADSDLFLGLRWLTADEYRLLVPATATGSSARVITLECQILDGRRARRFGAVNGSVNLNIRFKASGTSITLGRLTRSAPEVPQERALELLSMLQDSYSVAYIPSAREAGSSQFEISMRTLVETQLKELQHRDQGGAPKNYRLLKSASDSISKAVEGQAKEIWKSLDFRSLSGMIGDGSFQFAINTDELINWLVSQAEFRVSVGDGEAATVPAGELGSGLQSLIHMAILSRQLGTEDTKTSLLLLEEPEAFLHPSAQRELARNLFDQEDLKICISTHSTVVVDECLATDVVILRNHRLFAPRETDPRRGAINTTLLTGQGSEAIFAESVLLVEGPGDKAFFEILRRRLTRLIPSQQMSRVAVVSVGGCTRFAPWIQLLEGFVGSHDKQDRPIAWLAMADSADAASSLRQGLVDGKVSVPSDFQVLTNRVASAFPEGFRDSEPGVTATRGFNDWAAAASCPAFLVPVDLEYMALSHAGAKTIDSLCANWGLRNLTKFELMRKLGSKVGGKTQNSTKKEDWMRAELAESLDWGEVSPDVHEVLRRWLAPVLDDRSKAILAELGPRHG